MVMKYKTIILSDLHLGSKASRTKDIIKFLNDNQCDNLFLRNVPIKSLGNLESVGGGLNLNNTPIESLGNLQSVGDNLILNDTPISKKYTEEEIRQMVNVKGYIFI